MLRLVIEPGRGAWDIDRNASIRNTKAGDRAGTTTQILSESRTMSESSEQQRVDAMSFTCAFINELAALAFITFIII